MYRSDVWLESKLKALLGDADIEPLRLWIRAAREQPAVLFVGAGLSMASKPKASSPGRRMMDWASLTRLLKEGLGQDPAFADDSLWVAQKYKSLHGATALHSRIEEAVPDEHVEPGEDHLALRSVRWHAVLTLNYDTLLERALQGVDERAIAPVVFENQLARVTARSTLPIIHLHGHIRHADSIILTLEDFRRYPDDHAVFLTVARQLLLQHPVLFLGFGATDPNFVAWSGWIRDRIGEHSPPWVRLQRQTDRNTPLDRGMEAYWSPRLKTVLYEPSKFALLLRLLGQAVQPLDPGNDDFLKYIDELVDLLPHIGTDKKARFLAVVEEVEKALEIKFSGPIDFVANHRRQGRVIQLLHAALKRAGFQHEELERLKRQSKESVERWKKAGANLGAFSKVPEEEADSDEQKRSEVRDRLGDTYLRWLLFAVRLVGRFIPLFEGAETRFDAIEEYKRLLAAPAATQDASTLRQLGLFLLPDELERLGEDANETAVAAWLHVSDLSELGRGEKAAAQDFLRAHELRRGRHPIPDASAEFENAQAARRAGYLALLDGRYVEALQAYERAIELAQAENEVDALQYLTACSARSAFVLARAASDDFEDPERRDKLQARVKVFAAIADELQLDLGEAERDHGRDALKRLRDEVDSLATSKPEKNVFRGGVDPLEIVFDFYERYWFAPSIYAKVAEEIAETRWMAGEPVPAAAVLARFGSEELVKRTQAEVEKPRVTPVLQSLIKELLRPPHWPHERRVRDAALAEAVPELPAAELGTLLDRAIESYELLQDKTFLFATGHALPAAPAVSLGLSAGRYTPWPLFKKWMERLRAVAKKSAVQLADAPWADIPIRWWVRNNNFRGREADDFFGFLLELCKVGGWRFDEERVFGLASFAILNTEIALPADGQLATAMRAWAAKEEAEEKGGAWLRTEAITALAVIDGRPLADARRIELPVLRGVIDKAVQDSRWPDPYLIRAWLWAAETLDGDDRARGGRLLGLAVPSSTDALAQARLYGSQVMSAHVRLLIIAQLTPGSAEERDAWIASIRRTADSFPAGLSGMAERAIGELDAGLRDAFVEVVADAFIATRGHSRDTTRQHAALSCLAAAAKHSALQDIPITWLNSASALTTSAHPRLAAYASTVLRDCVLGHAAGWTAERTPILANVKRGLLRATADGRAYVVAAARRALLDIATTANATVREQISSAPETLARLAVLDTDERLAVVASGEPWTRDAP